MTRRKFGVLGNDVGVVGRWSRLVYGILILVPLLQQFLVDISSSFGFYLVALVYLIAISAAYTAVYWFFGEKLFKHTNPWLNTLIFVAPAILIAWWNFIFASIYTLPGEFTFAMFVYIGASLVLQWRIKYGGCEVVALPILLFKKRYTTYCIPLVVLDAAEKKIVER